MSYQLPFIRSIKTLTRPKGIAMRPRPASGIAHMARPRSPIHLDDGGVVPTQGGVPGDISFDQNGNLIQPNYVGMLDKAKMNDPLQNPLINLGLGALSGATGAAAFNYANNGRPTPIMSRSQDNPFPIPQISRTTDPVTQVVTQHVFGYKPWGTQSKANGGKIGYAAGGTVLPNDNTMFGTSDPMDVSERFTQAAYANGVNAMTNNSIPSYVPRWLENLVDIEARSNPKNAIEANKALRHAIATRDAARVNVMHSMGYAAGGQVTVPQFSGDPQREMQKKQVFLAAVEALRGKSPNPQAALKLFTSIFGTQALQELQQHLGAGQMPGQQPQQGIAASSPSGLSVQGAGDGTSDSVPAVHQQTGQPIQLSSDEFVVPADAVAALGNGSSAAGARKMTEGIRKVRAKRNSGGIRNHPPRFGQSENPILGLH